MAMTEPELNKSSYIVAIGASTGEMETIQQLFDQLPSEDVAYIIVQHFTKDTKSLIAELLNKHSALKINEAENGMAVKPNQVYIMPVGKSMTIKNKVLHLNSSKPSQSNAQIDIFLSSLAEDQAEKSIAVILDGMGQDGTKGTAAIKKRGGYVIVQEPSSTEFQEIPRNVIESGNADVVIEPHLISTEILSHLKAEELKLKLSQEVLHDNEERFTEILNLVKQHTPLDFTNYKRPTIIRRIAIRMTHTNIESIDEYIEYMKKNTAELEILANEFLISVTKFFRDNDAYQTLQEKVIPEIIKGKKTGGTLKIWVVGCATGEEAYSIAILISEHLEKVGKELEVKIFASDIDKNALALASKGVYNSSIKTDISDELLEKYFSKQNNQYKISEDIRKMIVFADHDIVKQPPFGKIDLISCRNLLIYFNPILQKRILSSLHFCLNSKGYLFLGPSESLGDLKESFSIIDKKWKIYRSIEQPRFLRDTTYSTPGITLPDISSKKSSAKPAKSDKKAEKISKQSIFEELNFEAGIYVNADFSILETYGN
ncbi:CheR family methyltransferase [Marivirga sp.]|uniref:CheR family methyltransferase n=1 Tax=Marivirga sp. TaxID=2018662 RepID=UPI002D7FB502|nr:CheR family methyltransferase [Marivirga sp.]HET8859545.1 CheR family methyltransferase [Marivirga sp.]